MARVAAVTTNTIITAASYNNLKDDYLSQTDTTTQDIRSDVDIANNAFQRTLTATTLGVAAVDLATVGEMMVITGDGGANVIATISGGVTGQTLTLLFVDGFVTITDDNTHAADTVDLSAAFVSADDTTLTLMYDGTSWYETSRSVN